MRGSAEPPDGHNSEPLTAGAGGPCLDPCGEDRACVSSYGRRHNRRSGATVRGVKALAPAAQEVMDCPRSAGEVLGRCARWPHTQDKQGAKKAGDHTVPGRDRQPQSPQGKPLWLLPAYRKSTAGANPCLIPRRRLWSISRRWRWSVGAFFFGGKSAGRADRPRACRVRAENDSAPNFCWEAEQSCCPRYAIPKKEVQRKPPLVRLC
jgi:hypothetical protein